MIKIGSKTLKTKNADGAWESFVASGITVDGEIDKSSGNAVANSAVAEALEGKISSEVHRDLPVKQFKLQMTQHRADTRFALLHGGEDTAVIRKRAQFRAIRLSRSLE